MILNNSILYIPIQLMIPNNSILYIPIQLQLRHLFTLITTQLLMVLNHSPILGLFKLSRHLFILILFIIYLIDIHLHLILIPALLLSMSIRHQDSSGLCSQEVSWLIIQDLDPPLCLMWSMVMVTGPPLCL